MKIVTVAAAAAMLGIAGCSRSAPASAVWPVFAEIITAASGYESSNRTHLPR